MLTPITRLCKKRVFAAKTGGEIDVPARRLYEELGWVKYIVCPFAHTIGLHAHSPWAIC